MRSFLVRLVLLGCVIAAAYSGLPADACTAFMVKEPSGPLVAKNFDWDVAAGQLVINPRGLSKTALVPDDAKPVRWTSRYGSLTFNQYGREFPMGGMNEAGLTMEVLWLDATEYPEAQGRRSIGPLQWVQYCLDSFRTVSEVVTSADEVAVSGAARLHFLACDPSTNCAVIEFLDGQLVARSERTLPLSVLTNDTYNDSLQFLNRTLGYGGDPVKPEGTGSLARYARAANDVHRVRSAGSEDPVADVFLILSDVAQPDLTQWSIVYELQGKRVFFRTKNNPAIRTVDLSKLDLDCTSEVLVLDLAAEVAGDQTSKLSPYDTAANLKTIRAGFAADAVAAPSPEVIQRMAAYPDQLICTFAEKD